MADDEAARLERAVQGDTQAFRQLIDAHVERLYRVCARIAGDAGLAEDALQEACLNAYRHLGTFDGRSAYSTWLHRIAVNAALEQLRRRSRHEVLQADADEDDVFAVTEAAPGPERHAASAQIGRGIQAVLARMSATERTAFVLRHHEGQSLEDISATLSLNVNACKQAIFRAVRKLRAAIEPVG